MRNRAALVSKLLLFGCNFDSTKKCLLLNCKSNLDFSVDSENQNFLINNKKSYKAEQLIFPYILLKKYSTWEGLVPRQLFKMNRRTRKKDHITV